eukprot:TRINITY_DN54519_c0_g1_i1.p1 TRINITY_DN54519_c0_g1~~TRINITY_DN54519_c0_g1_i1.p1  ORF type:complete len:575 (-),score=71.94 TRINITY_DN54519_c0_g1_i1:146-1870(-)
MSCSMYLVLIVGTYQSSSAFASGFLERIPESDIRNFLLLELKATFAGDLRGVSQTRLDEIDKAMFVTFEALPKNLENRLDHDGVRYLMNRFFIQEHGWSITNFHLGSRVNNSSPGATVMDRLPDLLQEVFETLVSANGASLKEVVLLSATLEHLIREDLRSLLVDTYQSQGIVRNQSVEKERAWYLMDLYTACFIHAKEREHCLDKGEYVLQNLHRTFPLWDSVKQLVREVLAGVAFCDLDRFTFDDIVAALEVVSHRFASFYEATCQDLKGNLVDMEDKRSGRVRLIDFYNAALHGGQNHFIESIELLRDAGALDESEATSPRVIIPNYITGLSNCIARTNFYSTCCPDACEGLLRQLERKLGKAFASPQEILFAIGDVEGFEISDSGRISSLLHRRLDEISTVHAGRIPIHGRLFMQWLHFIRPRDCSYPHLSSSTYGKHLDAWIHETGRTASLAPSDLKAATERLAEFEVPGGFDVLSDGARPGEDFRAEASACMWTTEEEVFFKRSPAIVSEGTSHKHRVHPISASVLSGLALVCFVGALIGLLDWPSKSQRKSRRVRRGDASAASVCFC